MCSGQFWVRRWCWRFLGVPLCAVSLCVYEVFMLLRYFEPDSCPALLSDAEVDRSSIICCALLKTTLTATGSIHRCNRMPRQSTVIHRDTLLRSHFFGLQGTQWMALRVHQRVAKDYHPVENNHLAVCDATSLVALDDNLASDLFMPRGFQVEAAWSEGPHCGEASLVLLPEDADGCSVALQTVGLGHRVPWAYDLSHRFRWSDRESVGFGTSSAGLHDSEAVAAKRRCLEEWRRLVVALPPGNPQCPMQLLRPSWSTSRLRLQCTQHQPLWMFSCGKTCALWPASDVWLGKVLCSAPCRETWLATGVHTFHFTVCEGRVFSAEHQIWAILVSSWSAKTPIQRRPSRVRGSSSIARIVRPGVTRRIVRLSET